MHELDGRAVAVAMPMGQEHEYQGVIDVVHMRRLPRPAGRREGDRIQIPAGSRRRRSGVTRAARGDRRVGRRADREVPRGRGAHRRGDRVGAKAWSRGHHLPGHLRRGDPQLRHARAARPDRRGPALAEARRRRHAPTRPRGERARASRTARRLRVQDDRRPVRRQALAVPRLLRHDHGRIAPVTPAPTARSACGAARGAGQGPPPRSPSSRRARSAPSASSRTCRPATCWSTPSATSWSTPVTLPSPVVSVAVEPAKKGEEEKINQALRRLQEEDPTLGVHRDERTGESWSRASRRCTSR